MAGRHVGNDGGIPVIVVELELVDHDKFRENIRFFEGFAIRSIFVDEHFFVDRLDRHLVESGEQRDLLVVEAKRQKALHVIEQWLGNLSAACLERDGFHLVVIAFRAFEPMFQANDVRGRSVERKVTELDGVSVVDVHQGTAGFADAFRPVRIQFAEEGVGIVGRGRRGTVDEAVETGRKFQAIPPIA